MSSPSRPCLGLSEPDGCLHLVDGCQCSLCGRLIKAVMTNKIPPTVPRCPICRDLALMHLLSLSPPSPAEILLGLMTGSTQAPPLATTPARRMVDEPAQRRYPSRRFAPDAKNSGRATCGPAASVIATAWIARARSSVSGRRAGGEPRASRSERRVTACARAAASGPATWARAAASTPTAWSASGKPRAIPGSRPRQRRRRRRRLNKPRPSLQGPCGQPRRGRL